MPTAINAFSAQDIERGNIDTLDRLASFTPGLIVSEAAVSSGGSISLRGIGSGQQNYLTDQAVAVNVDGMQVGSLHIRKNAQVDLQQIEILRGPQALFFGKNSPGGVVAFKTKDPGEELETEFSVTHELESEDLHYQALFSTPLGDSAGFRVVARYSDLAGYFNVKSVPSEDPFVIPPHVDGWPYGEEFFVRGTLAMDPSPRFSLLAKLNYSESKLEGGSLTPGMRVDCPLGVPFPPQPAFPCKANRDIYLGGAPAGAMEVIEGTPTAHGLGLRDNEQWLSTVKLEFALGADLALTFLTGFHGYDEVNAHNASAGPWTLVLVPYLPFETTQWTQELRLASNRDSAVNFMLGAFFERRDIESAQDGVVTFLQHPMFGDLFNVPFGTEAFQQDQEAFSIYGNILWDLSEAVELSIGLRYSDEEKSAQAFFRGAEVTSNLVNDSLEFDNLSPEVSLSWDLSDSVMIFGSYKEGFKSGGFDAGFSNAGQAGGINAPGYKNDYAEEEVEGFEFGLKGDWAQGLRFNLTAYSFDYTNLQVSSFDPASITFRVQNAGEARVQGLEADLTRLLASGWTLRASLAYNDSEYDDFLATCYAGQSIAAGCDQSYNPMANVNPATMEALGGFQEQDMAGVRLYAAPEWTATVGILYDTRFANGWGMDFSVDALYSSEYMANLRQSPQDLQDSFTKLNAVLALRSPSDQWELELSAFNLTDEYTLTQSAGVVFNEGGNTGTDLAFLGDRLAYVTRGQEVFLKLTYRN